MEQVKEEIKVNDQLNPDLWDENNELKPEVKEKIQIIVDKFIDNLKQDGIALKPIDVCIIGSNANFNYTKDSDIDVHIIADTSIIDSHQDLLLATYQAYKSLFNSKYDPMIKGHEVEVYVEDGEVHANSNGIYSLNDGWIKEPVKENIPPLDTKAFNEAFSIIEDEYKSIMANPTIEKVDKFIDKLYLLRQNGILRDGEFALENLLFKEARNLGYLQELKDKKTELETKDMSLESLKESKVYTSAELGISESLEEEYLDESAKTDFIDKFGQDTFDNFVKAKQRFINKGYSTDFGQYLRMDKKEIDDLILSLYDDKKDAQKKRILQGTDKEIRGKYRDLGIRQGYHVFEPLDAVASMDLGVNTGWCTTGRYKHYGHPEFTPSLRDAKKHWNGYTEKGIRFFYLLDPETMYGEYAIALYPRLLKVNKEIGSYKVANTNIEIYNAKDYSDFSLALKLDLSKLIDEKVIIKAEKLEEIEIKDNILIRYRGQDTYFIIPEGVETIGKSAFWNCSSLKSIEIPEGVTSIRGFAFSHCPNLTSITIPKSVTSIGNSAFSHCTSLTNITIPEGVTSIRGFAFSHCPNLTSITIPESVTIIENFAFADCTRLTSIIIPEGVTNIGYSAFAGCTGLTNITIPGSVIKMGKRVFNGCTSLKSIIYKGKKCMLDDRGNIILEESVLNEAPDIFGLPTEKDPKWVDIVPVNESAKKIIDESPETFVDLNVKIKDIKTKDQANFFKKLAKDYFTSHWLNNAEYSNILARLNKLALNESLMFEADIDDATYPYKEIYEYTKKNMGGTFNLSTGEPVILRDVYIAGSGGGNLGSDLPNYKTWLTKAKEVRAFGLELQNPDIYLGTWIADDHSDCSIDLSKVFTELEDAANAIPTDEKEIGYFDIDGNFEAVPNPNYEDTSYIDDDVTGLEY